MDHPNYDDTVLTELLQRVEDNRHSSFTFIRSWQERNMAKIYYLASRETAYHFQTLIDALLMEHCNQIADGKDDVDVVLAAKHLQPAVKFYLEEAAITKDSLDEYRAYITGGHFFENVVLNSYRKDEDCVDFRKLPWRFF